MAKKGRQLAHNLPQHPVPPPSLDCDDDAFFDNFRYGDVRRCGARRRKCSRCEHRFSKAERAVRACPVCGHDRRCYSMPKAGVKRCKSHGGRFRQGFATAGEVKVAFVENLPERLADQYAVLMQDRNLLSTEPEIGVLTTLELELTKRLGTGESGAMWKQLRKTWKELQSHLKAARDGDEKAGAKANACMAHIGKLITDGDTEEQSRKELVQLVSAKSEVAAKEQKRQLDAQGFLSLGEVMSLMAACVSAICEVVDDPRLQQEASAAVNQILFKSCDALPGQVVGRHDDGHGD